MIVRAFVLLLLVASCGGGRRNCAELRRLMAGCEAGGVQACFDDARAWQVDVDAGRASPRAVELLDEEVACEMANGCGFVRQHWPGTALDDSTLVAAHCNGGAARRACAVQIAACDGD